ncbi:MAG: hypothetical protein ACXVBB_06825, partial [Isosphaeraceae bacterium]
LSYSILGWSSFLRNGQTLKDKFGEKVGFHYSTREDPARPSRNRMTARVNDERRNFGAFYNFRVHQALGNLRTPRRF